MLLFGAPLQGAPSSTLEVQRTEGNSEALPYPVTAQGSLERRASACLYGFVPGVCRPYRPETKGTIESTVRFVKQNFWPGMSSLAVIPN